MGCLCLIRCACRVWHTLFVHLHTVFYRAPYLAHVKIDMTDRRVLLLVVHKEPQRVRSVGRDQRRDPRTGAVHCAEEFPPICCGAVVMFWPNHSW